MSPGDIIDIELVPSRDSHEFKEVLLVSDGENVKFGQPLVSQASVLAKVIDPEIKDKTAVIFKYKNKIKYRRKTGHRQRYTRVRIEEIKHGS